MVGFDPFGSFSNTERDIQMRNAANAKAEQNIFKSQLADLLAQQKQGFDMSQIFAKHKSKIGEQREDKGIPLGTPAEEAARQLQSFYKANLFNKVGSGTDAFRSAGFSPNVDQLTDPLQAMEIAMKRVPTKAEAAENAKFKNEARLRKLTEISGPEFRPDMGGTYKDVKRVEEGIQSSQHDNAPGPSISGTEPLQSTSQGSQGPTQLEQLLSKKFGEEGTTFVGSGKSEDGRLTLTVRRPSAAQDDVIVFSSKEQFQKWLTTP